MAQVIKPTQIVPFEISQLKKKKKSNPKTCQGQDLTSGKHSEAYQGRRVSWEGFEAQLQILLHPLCLH